MVMKVLLDTKSIFYNLEINFKELNNDTASLTEGENSTDIFNI